MLDFLKRLLGITSRKKPTQTTRLPPYYIEYRLYGSSKRFAVKISHDLAIRFGVKQYCMKGKPAHIGLFGGFDTVDEKRLILEFERFCKKYDLIDFCLGGFNHFRQDVIYLDVDPSQELIKLRRELAESFMQFTFNYSPFDKNTNFIFHTTLTKDIDDKFEKIWKYLGKIDAPKRHQYLLRICLLKNGEILREYDLIQRKMLDRSAALSIIELRKTFNLVKEIRKNGGKRITF